MNAAVIDQPQTAAKAPDSEVPASEAPASDRPAGEQPFDAAEPQWDVARGRFVDPGVASDDRTYAVIMHLTLLGHIMLPGIALIAPLIMWQTKKEQSPFLDDHGREAVNFHITMMLYSFVLPIIAVIAGIITLGIGLALLPVVLLLPYVLGVIGMIMAISATNRGEYFRYPMNIRLLK